MSPRQPSESIVDLVECTYFEHSCSSLKYSGSSCPYKEMKVWEYAVSQSEDFETPARSDDIQSESPHNLVSLS